MQGRFVELRPLDPAAHGDDLWAGSGGEEHAALWQYLFDGPYTDREAFDAHLVRKAASTKDPLFYTIEDRASGQAVGWASFMRIEPAHRVIEVGNILFTPALQRTAGATEAMYLMARHVFEEMGYRRYEWKCNSKNEPSRKAAVRLGFSFEGVFRQHMLVKGENRDTAWYSMLDSEWPSRKAAFEKWLTPSNFDRVGTQLKSLAALRTG